MDQSFIPSEDVQNAAIQALHTRGVRVEDIAQLTFFLQEAYIPGLTMEDCIESVRSVLKKREVQNALLTGIELDMLTEKEQLSSPLQQLIQKDESLYGVDEVLALSILNLYGSISFTNYGHIDKLKKGVLETLNDKSTGAVHAFLDDLVGAIAAAASSRLAHRYRGELEHDIQSFS
ncbi:MAG: phosphatidylglycerophosphatase A [Ectobacillus sp.]